MWKFLILFAAVFANNVNGQYPNQDWYWFDTIMDMAVGPEDAVHCRLISPSGDVNYDARGQCRVNILRVSNRHAGVWTMSVVLPDNVLPVEETFTARVYGSASGHSVTPSVEQNEPTVELMCSMPWSAPSLTGCLFRDPAGRVLQVRQGVDEDRYSFIQISNPQYQSCGLSIDGPVASDLGLWRCDLETTAGSRYGHLSVNASWVTPNPEAANTEPTLTSQTGDQVIVEGDGLTMSCSIQTGIRYCYFTKGNGTVYSVQPDIIYPSMAYVGNGFEAGECGIRLLDVETADRGNWSCHVGLFDGEEHRVEFSIEVQERMTISLGYDNTILNRMVVEATVAGTPPLSYCRFVRRDGLGFSSMNIPDGYSDGSSLSWGRCRLTIASPVIPHDYTWTVAAKVSSLDQELIRHIDIPYDEPANTRVLWWLWIVIPAILAAIVVVGCVMKRYCCPNSEAELRSA